MTTRNIDVFKIGQSGIKLLNQCYRILFKIQDIPEQANVAVLLLANLFYVGMNDVNFKILNEIANKVILFCFDTDLFYVPCQYERINRKPFKSNFI